MIQATTTLTRAEIEQALGRSIGHAKRGRPSQWSVSECE